MPINQRESAADIEIADHLVVTARYPEESTPKATGRKESRIYVDAAIIDPKDGTIEGTLTYAGNADSGRMRKSTHFDGPVVKRILCGNANGVDDLRVSWQPVNDFIDLPGHAGCVFADRCEILGERNASRSVDFFIDDEHVTLTDVRRQANCFNPPIVSFEDHGRITAQRAAPAVEK